MWSLTKVEPVLPQWWYQPLWRSPNLAPARNWGLHTAIGCDCDGRLLAVTTQSKNINLFVPPLPLQGVIYILNLNSIRWIFHSVPLGWIDSNPINLQATLRIDSAWVGCIKWKGSFRQVWKSAQREAFESSQRLSYWLSPEQLFSRPNTWGRCGFQ